MAEGNKSSNLTDRLSDDDNRILTISIVLIVIALLVSDFSYYRISQGVRLFFYAVVVRMWTQMGSGTTLLSDRDLAHVEFVLNAIGAVVIGWVIEQGIISLTGDIIAIQSLALAVVISRLYINMQANDLASFKEILQYTEDIDRYIVLVPCTVAFLIPIAASELNLGINFETQGAFSLLLLGSVLAGLGLRQYEMDT